MTIPPHDEVVVLLTLFYNWVLMMIIKQAPELRFKNSQSSAKGMPELTIGELKYVLCMQ